MNVRPEVIESWQTFARNEQSTRDQIASLKTKQKKFLEGPAIKYILGEMSNLRRHIGTLENQIRQMKNTWNLPGATKSGGELIQEHKHPKGVNLVKVPNPDPGGKEAYLYHEVARKSDVQAKERQHNALRAKLAELDAEFKSKKRTLKRDLAQAESLLTQHNDLVDEWVAKDYSHAQYAMAQDPTRADHYRTFYNSRNPKSRIGVPMAPVKAQPFNAQLRRKKSPPARQSSADHSRKVDNLWIFQGDAEFTTSDDGAEIIERISSAISTADIRGLNPSVLYDKLVNMSKMSRQVRSRLGRSHDEHWKKYRISKSYELLIHIDEEGKIITWQFCT